MYLWNAVCEAEVALCMVLGYGMPANEGKMVSQAEQGEHVGGRNRYEKRADLENQPFIL